MITYNIRPIQAGDGKGINTLRRMPGVFENILGIPSERIKRNEDFASGLDPNGHLFVATIIVDHEEIIVAVAGLHVFPNPRLRHSASLGIMVHKDYQGKGIGRKLMQTLLDVADNWLMLVRVELTVFSDNDRAIKLYESLGFEKEGLKRKAAIRSGEYSDEYMMARVKA
jgi:putative acetyltransferase